MYNIGMPNIKIQKNPNSEVFCRSECMRSTIKRTSRNKNCHSVAVSLNRETLMARTASMQTFLI